MKCAKFIKQAAKRETSEKCPSCPHTVNFFSHFQPDGVSHKEVENVVLVWGFFTGANRLFPLHLPALEKLSELAFAGNQAAASFLVQIATHLSFRIAALEKQQPKLMREIARKQNVWPVFTDTHTGWEKETLGRFAELGLGQGIRHIDIPFRKAGGCDANYSARLWAKAAMHCINQTRLWQRELTFRKNAVAERLENGHWKRGSEPAWVSGAKGLPDYSKQARPNWEDVIRKMIREELPDFHLRPDWKNQRNSCEARDRDSKGEIQNAILDDIISALKTITPEEINQSAENSLPNFGTQPRG
jgi:hypothetical protein